MDLEGLLPMRRYDFDPEGTLPVVRTRIEGIPASKHLMLALDTGCAMTEIDATILSVAGAF